MVLFCGRMLNNFPSKGGVSDCFRPRMLLTGENLDAKKDLPLEFCSYCQVHENEEPRNMMVGEDPSGPEHGTFGKQTRRPEFHEPPHRPQVGLAFRGTSSQCLTLLSAE